MRQRIDRRHVGRLRAIRGERVDRKTINRDQNDRTLVRRRLAGVPPPDRGGAAWAAIANIDKIQTSNRRFIISRKRTIYADGKNAQVDRALLRRGRSLPMWIRLSAHQVLPRLPFANQCELVAANKHFGWQRPRIVI